MKHIYSFTELNNEFEFIFFDAIDNPYVEQYDFCFSVDHVIYHFGKEPNKTVDINIAEKIYLQLLLNSDNNKELYDHTIKPILLKSVGKAKHLGFKYEEIRYLVESMIQNLCFMQAMILKFSAILFILH